jgi:hypothetical protein
VWRKSYGRRRVPFRDALVDAQQDDGGWKPNFLTWTPLVAHEWGGYLTLARLKTLKAYGRIAPGLLPDTVTA